MADLTDADILETADQLVKELALAKDDRDVIVLAVQRLVWPPSIWPFLHERPHVVINIGQLVDSGWGGELRCPHGCGRRWLVDQAPTEEAVSSALTVAHEEYRTGRATAVTRPPQDGVHRLDLDRVLGNRTEYVEVTDERLTVKPGAR